jgi:hypothetical protein
MLELWDVYVAVAHHKNNEKENFLVVSPFFNFPFATNNNIPKSGWLVVGLGSEPGNVEHTLFDLVLDPLSRQHRSWRIVYDLKYSYS